MREFFPRGPTQAGGFCNNATPAYDPADFDRLVAFSRRRLRDALPEIRRHVADHLRAKRDFLARTSPRGARAPPPADESFDVMTVSPRSGAPRSGGAPPPPGGDPRR